MSNVQDNRDIYWNLLLTNSNRMPDWQEQYTGFDPRLSLPRDLSEEDAKHFVSAYARFEDAMEYNNAAGDVFRFLEKIEQEKRSNTVSGVLKRAWFNTHLLTTRRGHFLSYLKDYLFECSESFQEKLPCDKFLYQTKSQKRILTTRVAEAKAPFERQSTELWSEYTSRMFGNIERDEQLSLIGFLSYLSKSIKIQYVEPWLLYQGQCMDEIHAAYKQWHTTRQNQGPVERMKDAYNQSGFDQAVNRMRELAYCDKQQNIRVHVVPHDDASNLNKRRGAVLSQGFLYIGKTTPDNVQTQWLVSRRFPTNI